MKGNKANKMMKQLNADAITSNNLGSSHCGNVFSRRKWRCSELMQAMLAIENFLPI